MTMEKMAYEAPNLDVTEVAVEQGIATTGNNSTEKLEWDEEMGW